MKKVSMTNKICNLPLLLSIGPRKWVVMVSFVIIVSIYNNLSNIEMITE